MNITKIAIVAADKNNVIGKDGKIPWKLSGDMAHFKAATMGYPVIMGRKTWDSFNGFRLPGRALIVVSRQEGLSISGVHVMPDIESAINLAEGIIAGHKDPKVFIIGGGEIYRQTIDIVDQIIFTRVDCEIEGGDASFPYFYDVHNWVGMHASRYFADAKNDHQFWITIYQRVVHPRQ